jgi:hypothetical protein
VGVNRVRRFSICCLFVALPGLLLAQPVDFVSTAFNGHRLGESVSAFLEIMPDVQQKVASCRQGATRPSCDRLLAAIDQGGRVEFAPSESVDFVLDEGKLVKLATYMNEDPNAATANLTAQYGPASVETVASSQAGTESKWQNQLFVWDTPEACVSLLQDNNPSPESRRSILIVESPAEHARTHPAKRSNLVVRGLSKVITGEAEVEF